MLKKLFLTTTAFALCAGGVVTDSKADDHSAKEGISLSGSVDFLYAFSGQADQYKDFADGSISSLRDTSGYSNSSLTGSYDGVTSGGLHYGGHLTFTDNSQAPSTNRKRANATVAHTYIESKSFGRIDMGNDAIAAQSMIITGASVARGGNGSNTETQHFVEVPGIEHGADTGYIISGKAFPLKEIKKVADATGTPYTPAAGAVAPTYDVKFITEQDLFISLNDNDTEGMVGFNYYSPKFSGFQIGLSYAPSDGTGIEGGSDYEDIFSAGLAYEGEISHGMNLNASFVMVQGSAENGTNLAATEIQKDDLLSYSLGLVLSYDNLSLAAGYTDNDDSGFDKKSDKYTDEYTGSSDAWSIGAAYDIGQFGASLTYTQANTDYTIENSTAPVSFENQYSNLVLGAEYRVSDGFVPYVEAHFFDYDVDSKIKYTPTSGVETEYPDNDGTIFILGTHLSF